MQCPFCRVPTTTLYVNPHTVVTEPLLTAEIRKPSPYTSELLTELESRIRKSKTKLAKTEILNDCIPDLFEQCLLTRMKDSLGKIAGEFSDYVVKYYTKDMVDDEHLRNILKIY